MESKTEIIENVIKVEASKFITTKNRGKLEDCIDTPIKKCVALLNLLGLETVWSCCGFDYEGQRNKDHVPGSPQIFIKANSKSFNLLLKIVDYELFKVQNAWNAMIKCMQLQEPTFILFCQFPMNKGGLWDTQNSPHFHERPVMCITFLEHRLLQFKDKMKNKVVLTDMNKTMKDITPIWGMNYMEDWIIRKEDWVKES